VDCTTPAETNDEENDSGEEKEEATEIKFLELLPLGFAVNMELVIGWWMVEELVHKQRKSVADDSNIVAPAPLRRCV
jgi:hypothetical protein